MHAIFYDLETSDKEPIGQILNYSFIRVDGDLNPVSELSGMVRISRLQLPRAGAILSNRIDVIEHQETARDDEQRAMKRIFDFLVEETKAGGPRTALIGFNSSKFDLPYLRTSLIRNGLNPYAWNSSSVEKDLLLAARKLSISDPNFPRACAAAGEKNKLSLRLEVLAQQLGFLTGKQSHFSREDVLLSIELARVFKSRFGMDPLSYNPYEGAALDREQRKAHVFGILEPNYDLNKAELSVLKPMTLLCADPKYALWIDLQKFKDGQGRRSINYIKKSGNGLFVAAQRDFEPEWPELAGRAQEEFKGLSLSNYFGPSVCDVEQFIYRMDFDSRDSLSDAIWNQATGRLSQMDAKILFKRHELRTYEWGGGRDEQMEKDLRAYALRRYGGQVVMSKYEYDDPEEQPDDYYHPTWNRLLKEIDALHEISGPEDRKLLQSLRRFYVESDLFRLAGRELESLTSRLGEACPA